MSKSSRATLWFWLAVSVMAAGWAGGAPLARATTQTYATNYVWDTDRRLTMMIEPDPGSGVRVATKYTYDADGQLTEEDKGTTPNGDGTSFTVLETTTYAYDAAGNKIQSYVLNGTTAPGLTLTQMDYDAEGRLLCTAVRMNATVYNSLAVTTTTGALPTAACTLGAASSSYGNDRITKTIYDAAGQTIQTIRAFGDALQQPYETYTYTPDGKPQTVTDAVGNKTTYVYDGFDRLAEADFPSTARGAGTSDSGDRELYAYDADDNRTQLTKRDNQFLSFCYDALNREVGKYLNRTVNCTSPPAMTGNEVASAYDLLNRKTSALFVSGQGVSYVWDNASRLMSETTNGKSLTFAYDPAGNRAQVTWPDAFYVEYFYDAMNRVTSVNANSTVITTGVLAGYVYDSLGRRQTVNRGNNTHRAYGFDNADRLNTLGETFPANASNQSWTYGYNPASQSVSETASNNAYKWVNHPVATLSKTYDGLNRDAAIAALGACAPTAGYDCNGNLTNDGARASAYDIENRLISVSSIAPAATLSTLVYDPLGRLQKDTAGSSVTQFVYDGDRLSGEYDGSGNLLRRYVHGPGVDEPLVWYEGPLASATVRWLHADREGSIIAWSDQDGTVTASQIYAYGPYGEPNAWGGSRFAYTGQIQLPEAQLYHYKARAYDPITGRFLQTDPVGYKDDVDLYAYVKGDPTNSTDPTGLESGSVAMGCVGVCGTGPSARQTQAFLNFALDSAPVIGDIRAAISFAKSPSWAGAVVVAASAIDLGGVAKGVTKAFSSEKSALVAMAKADKKAGGITKADMQAYHDLNAELKDPFTPNQLRGPETHKRGGPWSQVEHGHVGPVDHIPIKPDPPAPQPTPPAEPPKDGNPW